MANGRTPKRTRKKQRAAERRAAMLRELERRRRRQRITLAVVVGILVVGGAAVVLVASTGGQPKPTPTPAASPTPAPSPAPIACGGSLPPTAGTKKPTFEKAEDQKLDRKKNYIWRMETSCGTVDVQLAVARAPKTTNSIVFLTRKGFFDGLTFHRVVKDFVVQGGDPQGSGTGGSGYKVVEVPPKGQKYTEGVVAMAKAGGEEAGTSGSQFFIVTGSQGNVLTPDYALVGTVVAGLDVAKRMQDVAPEPGTDRPAEKIFIVRATIVEQ